jgi:hypothetical protein
LELWIGHSLSTDQFLRVAEPDLSALQMSLRLQLSQRKNEAIIGWLYGSTSYIDAKKVAASLRHRTGVQVWLRWSVIALPTKDGKYGKQERDNLVRALHVIVDRPDARQGKPKLLEVLSRKSKVLIFGSSFRFLPFVESLNPKAWIEVCVKRRVRQASFLMNLQTWMSHDVKLLFEKHDGTSFRTYLLRIRRDSFYDEEKRSGGAATGRQRLFISIDADCNGGHVYQFHQADRDQAHRCLKSLFAFMIHSDRSPMANVPADIISNFFGRQAVEFAAEGKWSESKQMLHTHEDDYKAEMLEVDDDGSDHALDDNAISKFEGTFEVDEVLSVETSYTSFRDAVAKIESMRNSGLGYLASNSAKPDSSSNPIPSVITLTLTPKPTP